MAELGSELKIGTSGYSYPGPPPKGWYGVFYPETKGKGFDELEYYASFFDTVEINTSFYRPPAPSMISAWVKKTPPDFRFAIKAWQKFTHPTTLGGGENKQKWEAPTQEDVDIFRNSLEPVAAGGKLGTLLFQYPASFLHTEKNLERLRWTLKAFEGYPKAVELRHRSWSEKQAETKVMMADLNTTWVVIDEPKFASSVGQEFEPVAGLFYLRLHGRNHEKWWRHAEPWERYDYFYKPEEIRFFAEKIREIQQGASKPKITVLLNNHARGQAVANAFMLKHELGLSMPRRAPRTLVGAFPQLAGMVRPAG